MRWRSESALNEQIELRNQELASLKASGASGCHDDHLVLFVELQDLRNELEFVRGNPSASDDADLDSLVCAPLKPVPNLNSGSVALPEPDWVDPEANQAPSK